MATAPGQRGSGSGSGSSRLGLGMVTLTNVNLESRYNDAMSSSDPNSLSPTEPENRREFLVKTLAVGFALAVQPSAPDRITTDTNGLVAGEVKIPVKTGRRNPGLSGDALPKAAIFPSCWWYRKFSAYTNTSRIVPPLGHIRLSAQSRRSCSRGKATFRRSPTFTRSFPRWFPKCPMRRS